MKIVRLWKELEALAKSDDDRKMEGFSHHSDSYFFKRGEIKDYIEKLLVTIQTSPDPMYLPYCEAMAELAYYNSRVSIISMLRFK